jgi:hypothetical protein
MQLERKRQHELPDGHLRHHAGREMLGKVLRATGRRARADAALAAKRDDRAPPTLVAEPAQEPELRQTAAEDRLQLSLDETGCTRSAVRVLGLFEERRKMLTQESMKGLVLRTALGVAGGKRCRAMHPPASGEDRAPRSGARVPGRPSGRRPVFGRCPAPSE